MLNPLAPRTLADLIELLRDSVERGYHTKASLYADAILDRKPTKVKPVCSPA